MGKFSREKGKRGEREFAILARLELGAEVVRNLMQSREGGAGGDILGVQNFAVEVKRAAVSKVAQWWEQTKLQCGEGQLPALAYKLDRLPWIVRLRAGDVIPELATSDEIVEMTTPAFFMLVRERISADALNARIPETDLGGYLRCATGGREPNRCKASA